MLCPPRLRSLVFVLGLCLAAPPALAQELSAEQRGTVVDQLIRAAELEGEDRRAFLAQLAAEAPDPDLAAAFVRARQAATDDATLDGIVRAALDSPESAEGEPTAEPMPTPEPPASEPALALPAGQSPPPRERPAPDSAAVVQRPRSNLDQIRNYQANYLELAKETNVHGGGATYVRTGWWGWRGRWRGGVAVVPNAVYTTQSWAVYQASRRLDVPEFFDIIGEEDRALSLSRDINRYRRTSTALYVTGAVGLITSIVGWYGSRFGATPAIRDQYALAGLAGTGVSLVGFIGGAIPASRARHTEVDFPYVIEHSAAKRKVNQHNEELRQDLGLSERDALRAEDD